MKFLFIHRNFPAQFKNLLFELSKNPSNEIIFLTNTKTSPNIKGIHKIIYELKREVTPNSHRYVRPYEESILHGQAVAEVAINLKKQGFNPDVIYAHSWGNSMFLKDIYPQVPFLGYFEWFYNSESSDIGFAGDTPNYDTKAKIRSKNAPLLIDLYSCDKGISPTYWQKKQFPVEFQDKIEVLHDGVDTDYFIPDTNVEFKVPNTDIILSSKDEVITYATRGMEPYRGFPQFLESVEKLLKKRPNLKVLIGGEDRVCYGAPAPNGKTFKTLMLEKLDLDLSRVYFTGGLPYAEYKKLLQISSAHIYLTYPFILSWSLLEAMSVGCCVIGSKTPPVEEIISNNKNGFLVDFYNIDEISKKIEYALDNKQLLQNIRHNARQTIIEKYDLKKLLPKHLELLNNLAKNRINLHISQ